ncbi:hypothetical protein COB72_02680 [bacterium]|nr:MAG: hypothetical protein COB72_02680 [bacterium]
MVQSSTQFHSNDDFSHEAVICVRQAQAAFADLLSGAGLEGARPTEIGRILGLDKTLAWKVSKFSDSSDLLKAVKHIPGSGGVEIVLKAAQAKGVDSNRILAVRDADRVFRDFVRNRAGDRRSFEAMLAAGGRDDKIELEERKAFYQSGSAIWGVRAKVQFLTLCIKPSIDNPDRLDMLQLSGFMKFERLRSDVPWIIRRLWHSDTETTPNMEFKRAPLCPEASTGTSLPLIPEFCSQPLPEINQFVGTDGVIYDELAPGIVGKHGSLDCVTGEHYRSALPRYWSEDNTFGRYELMLRTPVEHVVFDVFIHESLTNFGEFSHSIYGLLEGRPSSGEGKSHDRPVHEAQRAQFLGAPPIVQASHIGIYPGLINYAFDRAQWGSLSEFRGYRCVVEYPATPWCLTMECPISKE